MTLTSGFGGCKRMTVNTTAYRGPVNGQGTNTASIPTAYLAGQPLSILRGFWLLGQDAALSASIRIGDARGKIITSPTSASTLQLTFPAMPAAGTTPAYIPFGPEGIWVPFWHFFGSSVVWAPATKTLTLAGMFTNYSTASGVVDVVEIQSGTGVVRGTYRIASRDSNDQITLVDSIGSFASTDIVCRVGYGGGFTASTTDVDTKGSLHFNFVGGQVMATASYFMFIDQITAAHPTDTQGGNTTTLAPVPEIGRGRTGARITGLIILSADAAAATTISIGLANGTVVETIPVPAGLTCPYPVPLSPGGIDLYSSSEGLFTCWSSDADTTGIIMFGMN